MRLPHLTTIRFVIIVVCWTIILHYYFFYSSKEGKLTSPTVLHISLNTFQDEMKLYKKNRDDILNELEPYVNENKTRNQQNIPRKNEDSDSFSNLPSIYMTITNQTIGVLLLACNRISVQRSLSKLVKYRPSIDKFPIVVSQDCVHNDTSNLIDKFIPKIFHIHQPDQSGVKLPDNEKKFEGYFKISRHYKWALNVMFKHYKFRNVIIVEDDLDISPDFYGYFSATLPILRDDETLWCVSAWNDNGKTNLIDHTSADLLYRSDFFPGLGWMLTDILWSELEPKWPKSYWDDWMRLPEQRRNRACIRPELSRTRTFGKIGVSNGLFYDKHLKFIYLNEQSVNFNSRNLNYLKKNIYDVNFTSIVYGSPVVKIQDLKENKVTFSGSVRILYHNNNMLQNVCKMLGLMDDFKSGVPRTAYLGIVSCVISGRRVYITPSKKFTGYNKS